MIEKLEIPSSEHYFRWSVRSLKLAGLHSVSSIFRGVPRKSSWWEIGPFVFASIVQLWTLLATWLTVISMVQEGDIKSIEILASVISLSVAMIKGIILGMRRNEIYNLLQIMVDNWEVCRKNRAITINIKKYTDISLTVQKSYAIMIFLVSSSFVFRPQMLMIHYFYTKPNHTYDFSQSIYYEVNYPITIQSYSDYYILLIVETLSVYFAALYMSTCDALFVQILTHLTIQFEVLKDEICGISDLKNISITPFQRNKIMKERLKSIVIQHNKLLTCCSEVEHVFNPIVFSSVLSDAGILCCSVYSMSFYVGKHQWMNVFRYYLLGNNGIIESAIYCFYADNMTQKTALIADTIYNLDWSDFNKEIQLMLLTIIIRASHERELTAYGMITINMQQITIVVNAAIRYFTLLRTLTDN